MGGLGGMGGMGGIDWSGVLPTLPATAATALAVLGATFLVALRVGKHAVVDVAWGLGFVAVALVSVLTSDGDGLRAAVLLAVVALWGVRLATHIGLRSRGRPEDPRYQEIADRAPGDPRWYLLRRVYLTQAAVLWFVSLPVQVGVHGESGAGPLLAVGLVVWAVGLGFETVGDWQLTRFRNDPDSAGKVLRTGLWRYTRHPNYFGDACAWWGIFLVALDAGAGVGLTVLSPVLLTWLLAKGTGKPLLERDIGERRPEYADYVARTSGFVPLPPRTG